MFREDYIRENKIIDKTEQEHTNDLYKDLEDSKNKLLNLHENLNFASRRFS